MGDQLPRSVSRNFSIDVHPLAPIEFVQIIKNGRVAQIWPGPNIDSAAQQSDHILRIEWGWDRLDSTQTTQWDIDVEIGNGHIDRIRPCFVGGAGSHELLNQAVLDPDTHHLKIVSFTSRRNPLPVSGVVLSLRSDHSTVLKLSARTQTDLDRGACDLSASIAELLQDDRWCSVLPRFSAPKLRIGRPYPISALAFQQTWTDPVAELQLPTGDFYVLKVQQTNGQLAWSSPIWIN
jgi:hypothetical protein